MQAVGTSIPTAVGEYRGDYWQQSRRPLTSLAFVTPLLAIYELGVLWLGPQALRNGADLWLRQLLDLFGFTQYFLLPLATAALLAGWHYVTRDPWRISVGVLYAVLAECLLLSVALVVLARLQGSLLSMFWSAHESWALHAAMGELASGVFRRMVGFMGAGIYEELLFRLMLLPVVGWVLRWCGVHPAWSLAAAAVVSSLIFAGAHHWGSLAEPFQWYAFIFRTGAGLFFAALFLYRGFGIAAGTHAAYDMLVGLI